jgi:two-component system OmpR family response regulator
MRVLIVEDEQRLANLLRRGLTEERHSVDLVGSGEEALDWLACATYDAIVLDVMLPGIDGLDVCRRLRKRRVPTPILLLTARDAVPDRVSGLDAGADDYMVKPFEFAELAARLRALARRPPEPPEMVLEIADLRLDPVRHRVWRGGTEIELQNKEFRILDYLMRNADRIVTRSMIVDHVWGYAFANSTNVVDVHIRGLRRKLDDPFPGHLIQTVRGVGYRVSTGS